MHCPAGGGFVSVCVWTSDTDSFADKKDSVRACAELTASSTVSELGRVLPPLPLVPDSEGLVLETSITWMSAMESSVHGTGSVDEAALLTETFVMLAYTSTR